MKIKGKLRSGDLALLGHAVNEGHAIEIKATSPHSWGSETIDVFSNGWGENWYLFAGHLMQWGLIQASSFEDAFDHYLSYFVRGSEKPDDELDMVLGHFDAVGRWYSEVTISHIMQMPLDRYDFDVTITQGEDSE
tara:strand:+ start:62 stop:466 length:405 start_codon:yes stop_codon:yes gene_type:complete